MKVPGSAARRRERLAKTQEGICPACNLPLPEDLTGTEVDHTIPRCRGGPDLVWNRRLLHLMCNRDKRDRLTDEAIVLAAEHGVVLHVPLPVWSHADRPLTQADSLRRDYLNELFSTPPAESGHVVRQYLDEIQRTA